MFHTTVDKIKRHIAVARCFNYRIVFSQLLVEGLRNAKFPDSIQAWAWELNHRLILSFLTEKFYPLVERYKDAALPADSRPGDTIWACWWQGEENAPPLVKGCLQNLREKAGNHPVVVIDLNNWADYVEIPDHIMKKFDAGMVSLMKLANVVRIALLNQYGGIWLDATVYAFRPIPDEIFAMPFFTCKQFRGGKSRRFISQTGKVDLWATNMIGGFTGHPLFRFLLEYFSEYWAAYSLDIAYLWFDYGIRMAYDHCAAIKNDIDAVPVNCPDCFGLYNIMNDAYTDEAVNALRDSNNLFFKLSHESKSGWKPYTDAGEETVYHRLFLKGGQPHEK